jgi:hypothetical protein
MSYHSPWEWTDDLTRGGFIDELKVLEIEYRSLEMDTKRNSSDEWKQSAGKEARDLIDTWKPDLVYTTDDNAQKYVASYYINSNIPFVFSGVNDPPEEYGFVGSSNISGVLEEGRSPSSFPMRPTLKGEPIVSLARARKLGINLTSEILLTARIVRAFDWEVPKEQ